MITLLYAGLCTLLVVFLAVRVAMWRFRHKIGIGDGGDRELLKRVRAHANAIENMPLALILLGGMLLGAALAFGLWGGRVSVIRGLGWVWARQVGGAEGAWQEGEVWAG